MRALKGAGVTTVAADDGRFADFYRASWDRLVRRAFLIVGSVAAAEDVVQDAMSEVFRRWDTVENPAAYASGATVNGALRRLRRQGRERLGEVEDLPHADPHAEYLDDVLVKLRPKTRAILVLKFYEGMSEAEIAETVGCRPGTVGPTITRALRHLSHEVQR